MLSDVRFHRLGVKSVFPVAGQSASLNHYVAESNWQSKCRGKRVPATVSLICSLCGLITGLCRTFSHSKPLFFLFFFFYLELKSHGRLCVKIDFETQSLLVLHSHAGVIPVLSSPAF